MRVQGVRGGGGGGGARMWVGFRVKGLELGFRISGLGFHFGVCGWGLGRTCVGRV